MNQPPIQRIRIYYAKQSMLRYTSNLDLHRIWERSFRRAKLPLAYSQGFHPQPRINQACPLPLGMTSQNDMLEIWFEVEVDLLQAAQALKQAVPPGLEITSIQTIDLRAPTLPTLVISAHYQAILLDSIHPMPLQQSIDLLLASPNLQRTRRDKPYDLRPLIEKLIINPTLETLTLEMQLATREGATGRPEEVLSALDVDPLHARICRTSLILSS